MVEIASPYHPGGTDEERRLKAICDHDSHSIARELSALCRAGSWRIDISIFSSRIGR